MLKHVRRGAALILSMAMFIQLGIGNNYITFASEESQTPEQTQEESGTTTPETTGEVPEQSSDDATGTQESTEPAPETGNNEVTVPEKEAASTLVVQFVNEDKTNIDVNQYPDKEIALTDLYVNDPYQLVFNDYQINTEIEGYTLSKIVDANDAQKEYPLTTIEQGYVDITLSQNITKLQLVYTKNSEPAQQPENNQTETDNQQPSEEQEESSEEDGQQVENGIQGNEEVEDKQTTDSSNLKTMPLKLLLNDITKADVITVLMSDDVGGTNRGSFNGGLISKDTVPQWDEHTFTNATVTVDDTQYIISYLVRYNGELYYATEDNANVATLLENQNNLVFHYEKNVTKYNVTYNEIGETGVAGNSYEGLTEVKEGSDLSFSVNTAIGYEAEITINDGISYETKEENSGLTKVYTVENVTNNLQVSINYVKINTFDIDLSWKDNQYDYDSGHLHQGDIISENGESFNDGDTVTWTIKSYNTEWQLNGLSINGENVKIPVDFTTGASETTYLTNGKNAGIEVTVTCNGTISEGGYWQPWPPQYIPEKTYYTHTVTIKNAHTDLTLTYANLRAVGHAEVMPLDIVGVTLNGIIDGEETRLETATPQAQSVFGNPMQFNFTLNEGYNNPIVNVNGERINPNYDKRTGVYSFTASKDRKVVTVSVIATKAEYRVEYDLNGGEDTGKFVDSNVYSIDQPTILINSNIPERDSKYFAGWKIEGDEDTLYQPGDTVSINDIDVKNTQITFIAQWVDEPTYGTWVDYNVVYNYQTDIDSYEEAKKETYKGIYDTTVAMFNAPPTIEKDGVIYYLDSNSDLVGIITGNDKDVA